MNRTIIGVIVVLVVVIGGWYLLKGVPANTPPAATTETPVTTTTTTTTSTTTTSSSGVTVIYGAQGFSPQTITVPLGTTVTFVSQGADEMWIASDPHPTHQGYDGTTKNQHCAVGYSGPTPFDQCSTGMSYSFTFLKAGTWGYHNHGAAGDRGTVVVTAPTTR
jgi:plastocyanin